MEHNENVRSDLGVLKLAKKVFEEITAKQTMNRVKEPRMPFDWSINPYRGCTHGCSFCYARNTHSFLGMNADDSFQNHIFLKRNAAEALENQLAKLARKHGGDLRQLAQEVGMVTIGTATDPYQQVEGKAKLTRECLKVLARYQIPTSITTRSPLILRDLDILQEIPLTSINISINTLDTELYRRLEPATSFPFKRLETVEQLVSHDLPAGIFLAPILPYLTDGAYDLEELIAAAKRHRAAFVTPSVLRLVPEVKAWYFSVLKQHHPNLLPAYQELYRSTYPPREYTAPLMERVYALLGHYELSPVVPTKPNRQPVESAASSPIDECHGQRVEQLSFLF
ncbi:radical SAM protein [Brevibacillus humidisoli]|uniref:SPL family radical SAM protein n=1 Tax=Brevibacillus humidisoli TaxID=2895522 RepID=UPI001E4E954D|nr:radical SAM protein [Brevibacillus humidisoli]UFJ41151.1 radical SAM protein [Brevibacillus humidisoli]